MMGQARDGLVQQQQFGLDIKPRAIATIRCWPPERVQPSALNGLIPKDIEHFFGVGLKLGARAAACGWRRRE
jgi:hypothetical protein